MKEEKETAFQLIFDLFYQQYRKDRTLISRYLDYYEDTAHRQAFAKNEPNLAKFVEAHTREELKDNIEPVAIVASLAEVFVQAHQILHSKTEQ
ncbi:MAG: hypothetical protein ISS58_08940 [Dehalococcoidales bacterium]|nr:hypothetical protein [Dehalococcoidales bacterium]